MILTRHDIHNRIQSGEIVFSPQLDQFQNQPHAVDLRLGTVFYIPKIWTLEKEGRRILTVDVTQSAGNNFEKLELQPGQYFELAPGESILASTLESITLSADDIMGILYPRSSINRRGLTVDLTGIIDAHYSGSLMIPILNRTTSQVIRLYVGERICQVVFHMLKNPILRDDALMHGMGRAKYDGADACDILSKKDSETEMQMLKNGNLEGIKSHPYSSS